MDLDVSKKKPEPKITKEQFFAISDPTVRNGEPLGVIRQTTDDRGNRRHYQYGPQGQWVEDATAAKHAMGFSDSDVTEVTESKAKVILDHIRSLNVHRDFSALSGQMLPRTDIEVCSLLKLPSNELELLKDTAFKELREFLSSIMPERDLKMVDKAFLVADRAHRNQTRDEGTPYIFHPLRVASILARELGVTSCEAVCAALLHDVLEDSKIQASALARVFGEQTGSMVSALTKQTPKPSTEDYLAGIEHHPNQSTALVKLADRVDNVRSLPHSPKAGKLDGYLQETRQFFVPLAERCSPVASELLSAAIIVAGWKP